MPPDFTKPWTYRSFRNNAATLDNPVPLEPWSPAGTLKVDVATGGTVTGTLTFEIPGRPPLSLTISGHYDAAAHPMPTLDLTGMHAALGNVNRLRGWYFESVGAFVGSIVSVTSDPGKQPNGTTGPFVLVPT